DRLLMQLLPPDVDVERLLASQNPLKLALQLKRCSQPRLSSSHLIPNARPLPLYPVLPKVGVRQLLERLSSEAVIVDERREAVTLAVPDMPDEWPVLEQPAVLPEEVVAQPFGEVLPLATGSAPRRRARDTTTPASGVLI